MNTRSSWASLPQGEPSSDLDRKNEDSLHRPRSSRRKDPLSWWYRLAAPAEPAATASLAQREVARRGRLTSIILLAVVILLLFLLPVAAFGRNHVLLPSLLVGLAISAIVLFFNRHGNINVAGTLVVLMVIAGQTFTQLSSPGGLTMNTLTLLDQFVISELVAISFLPPISIFFVAAVNSLIFWALLNFLHHDAQVGQLLATGGGAFSILLRPIILQGIVAVVAYLWVRSALNALARADRAEEIAALEQREIERQQQEIEHKHQLDLGIQQILQTHVEVANGNFRARAPLTRDNILWQIAFSLNNLLARIQRLNQSEYELQQLKTQHTYQVGQLQRQLVQMSNELQWVKAEYTRWNAEQERKPPH